MKGTLLDFSITENTGVVSGDDGNRYRFAGSDWKATGAIPRAGARVDFVAADGVASEVYLDTAAAPAGWGQAAPSAWGQAAPSAWGQGAPSPDGLDDRYRGLYCSSDEKMVLGLCGGLAHKFGVQVGVMRVLMFLVMMFVLWVPYLVGIFLPKVPTRGVPRPV
jgi:phage shock protein PspC (stress-responsive transcriptional regulator)